jgi:transcriptional regulator with XRE-family HTH domain
MGTASRERPARLAEKLAYIRHDLGLSQDGILSRMGLTDRLTREDVSKYERDLREPPLSVLLSYAQVAGVWVDALIDDEVDLPTKLPSTPKSAGVRRRTSRGRKR